MDIKLKKVKQSSGMSGPASLSSLLYFYGVKMSERELASLCGSSKGYGTEPDDMLRVLKNLGFKAKAKADGTWSEIKKLVLDGTPVLVNWESDSPKPKDNHYSLVYNVTPETVHMMDPEIGGYRRLGKERFMGLWHSTSISGKKSTRWYLYIAK